MSDYLSRLRAPNPEFKERIEEMLSRQYFMQHIDFHIDTIRLGYVAGKLTRSQIHEQQFGILHGGVVSTLADVVAGFATYTLAPASSDVVTAEIKISYFRAGKNSDIRARGWVVKAGRNFAFVESEVYELIEGVERILAKATTTMSFIHHNNSQD